MNALIQVSGMYRQFSAPKSSARTSHSELETPSAWPHLILARHLQIGAAAASAPYRVSCANRTLLSLANKAYHTLLYWELGLQASGFTGSRSQFFLLTTTCCRERTHQIADTIRPYLSSFEVTTASDKPRTQNQLIKPDMIAAVEKG